MTFAARCGVHDAARAAACDAVLERVAKEHVEQVRVAWADLHGSLRGKTLVCGFDASPVTQALQSCVGMISTLLLKDTSDRTAFKVFEPGGAGLPAGFGAANNLVLLPDPASYLALPWAPGTGWMRAEPWFDDGTPVPADPRRVLRRALAVLGAAGFGLRCGLEVEFHIFRITAERLALADAAWPAEPPAVALLHPGYQLLSESWADQCAEPLDIVRRTALALGLPLRSLEIELGPSQFEAVFGHTDALTAADQMVLFRNGVRQALRRAGYHASFVCRPPFPNVMASRRSKARWPAAGTCTIRWCTPTTAATPWALKPVPALPPQRRAWRPAARATGSATPARTGWPGCWCTPTAWPRCARPASTPTAGTAAA